MVDFILGLGKCQTEELEMGCLNTPVHIINTLLNIAYAYDFIIILTENLVELERQKDSLRSDSERISKEKTEAEAALKHMTSLYDKANHAISRYDTILYL